MKKRIGFFCLLLIAASLLAGCNLRTVDEMYRPPRRSQADDHLQAAIDTAMEGLDYAAPVAGENQQIVQTADLTGDGQTEYIVFARDSANKSIRLLVFAQEEKEFVLMWSIESHGTAFEQVEYVNVDNKPGLEMVVGRRISDQVLRSLSVYSFSDGTATQLMTVNYLKFLTCNLDEDETTELMVIQPGDTDADRGVAVLYSMASGTVERSREVTLSSSGDSVKRIMTSRLQSGEPAVYVASSVDESAVITDIFTIRKGEFTNISYSNESGTSVQTLRNYYVYADDIDVDGVLELPSLITMKPLETSTTTEQQYLIRWYSMDITAAEHTKGHTFHNYLGGWYLDLDDSWAERVSVVMSGNTFWFYVWDREFENAESVFSVHVLTGANREEIAEADNRFILLRAEGVIYSARLAGSALPYELTKEDLINSFHLIHQAWKTGET